MKKPIAIAIIISTILFSVSSITGAKPLSSADSLFAGSNMQQNQNIILKVPDIAENRHQVSVHITSKIKHTEAIAILVKAHTNPLVAYFSNFDMDTPELHTRIKMEKSSQLIVVVKAKGKLYFNHKFVKVIP